MAACWRPVPYSSWPHTCINLNQPLIIGPNILFTLGEPPPNKSDTAADLQMTHTAPNSLLYLALYLIMPAAYPPVVKTQSV